MRFSRASAVLAALACAAVLVMLMIAVANNFFRKGENPDEDHPHEPPAHGGVIVAQGPELGPPHNSICRAGGAGSGSLCWAMLLGVIGRSSGVQSSLKPNAVGVAPRCRSCSLGVFGVLSRFVASTEIAQFPPRQGIEIETVVGVRELTA